jgi:hypothetical protein
MPKIEFPHGKTSVKRFVEAFDRETGVAIRVMGVDGKACTDDTTLASIRDASCEGGDAEFESTATAASVQEAMLKRLGLTVEVLKADGSVASGGSRLDQIRAERQASVLIVSTDERVRADQISIIGQKLISTVQEEFTAHHPYLGLVLFSSAEHEKSQNGVPAKPLPSNKTIASVREKKSKEELSINGNMIVGNLEARIAEVYGLYAQVCIMNDAGKRAYTGESHDKYTLSQLNRRQQEKGRPGFRYG